MRASSAVFVLGIVALAACQNGTGYTGGTLVRPGSQGERVGCVEAATWLTHDAVGGYAYVTAATPVLLVAVGNACRAPMRVHVERLRVWGIWADGEQVPMHFYDPYHEVRAAELDGHGYGWEKLELDDPSPRSDAPVEVCVDVSAIGDPPAPHARPVCHPFSHPRT